MKKIIFAVPAFALLASSFALSGCGDKGKSDNDSVTNVRKEASAHEATTNIAFVNMDTVYSQYTLAKELNAESEKYATDHQRWANGQQQSLQNSLNTLQQKVQAGQMTQAAAEAEYEQIMRRGQALDAEGQKRATATQELIAGNAKRVQDSIHNFLVDFNADHKYDAILSTDMTSPVLIYNPALDITAEVVSGLNARYKSAAPEAPKAEEKAPAKAADKK